LVFGSRVEGGDAELHVDRLPDLPGGRGGQLAPWSWVVYTATTPNSRFATSNFMLRLPVAFDLVSVTDSLHVYSPAGWSRPTVTNARAGILFPRRGTNSVSSRGSTFGSFGGGRMRAPAALVTSIAIVYRASPSPSMLMPSMS
jgi:hypothetical protein